MHILIATDGSTQSAQTAEFLRDLVGPKAVERITVLAVRNDSPILAVLETEPDRIAADRSPSMEWELTTDSARRWAHAAAGRVAEIVEPLANRVDRLVRSGNPAHEIAAAAAEAGVDLIVVGSHGQGMLSAILLGSVSEGVMHHARKPVLIVPHVNDARPAEHPGA